MGWLEDEPGKTGRTRDVNDVNYNKSYEERRASFHTGSFVEFRIPLITDLTTTKKFLPPKQIL